MGGAVSGRRWRASVGKAGPIAPTPGTRDKHSRKKPTRGPSTPEQRIADAAVEAARVIAPTRQTYDQVRGDVIRGFAMAFARLYGMPGPIDGEVAPLVLPVVTDDLDPEHFGCVHEVLAGYKLEGGTIAPSSERRHGGVHYTPRTLTAPIVAKTLEPLFAANLHPRTLDYRVCDPAVGAGAFLLEAVRQMAGRMLALGEETDLLVAKRLVAMHCCYGLDISRWAVASCKIALWLECRAWHMPHAWLDHNIRQGDALVGVSRDQFVRFHWKPGPKHEPIPQLEKVWDEAAELGKLRRQLELDVLMKEARHVA